MALIPVTIADKAVTTAGTRVQLSSTNVYCSSLYIQALGANTGKMYVGDVNVASTQGAELSAGANITFGGNFTPKGTQEYVNLADFYIDSSVNGEKVHIVYLAQQV